MNEIKFRDIPIKYIVTLFVVSRTLLTFIGVYTRSFVEPYVYLDQFWIFSKYSWLTIWGTWDTGWYLGIAEHGYSPAIIDGMANYGFFPLYPYAIKVFSFVTRNEFVAGIILSNFFLLVSCIYLYKLARLHLQKEEAKRSIKFLFLFPSAFIFSAVFTESLFLALLVMVFYYAQTRKWFLVGIIGFLLTLTRSIGIFMILPLAYIYLQQIGFTIKRIRPNILYLFFIPLGLLFFMYYTYILTGDFFAHTNILRDGWEHTLTNPILLLFQNILEYADGPRFINSLFSLTVIIFLGVFYEKVKPFYIMAASLLIFVPMFFGANVFNSMFRYLLPVFPIYFILAQLTKERWVNYTLTIGLVIVQAAFMVAWVMQTPLII